MRGRIAALSLLALGACEPSSAAPRSRVQRMGEEVLAEFPDLEERFAEMSYDEAFRDGGDLAQRGMPRLEDGELVRFMRYRLRLLERSDEACEALVGGGDSARSLAAFDALSDDELRAWFRVTSRAQRLEVRGGPRPLTAEASARIHGEAIERIRGALSPIDRERWDGARSSVEPDDACFLERTALRELLRLPPDEAARLHRAMLERALLGAR